MDIKCPACGDGYEDVSWRSGMRWLYWHLIYEHGFTPDEAWNLVGQVREHNL